MKKQSGFTLVEIAIVLVIIGLLLGGVLKGQALINNAKVKNFAQDFRSIPLFIHAYQDKYRAIPGDHATANPVLTGATNATTPGTSGGSACAGGVCRGNGVIDGTWNSTTPTDETFLFWQHVRLAGLSSGPTHVADPNFIPKNTDGGIIGIESGSSATGGAYISGMAPNYLACSSGILGRFAKRLDITLDDGNTETGSVRVVTSNHIRGEAALPTANVDDAGAFIVCMGL